MAWPQTGILLYKMVCPHLFLGNRLYKMVVRNPFCQHPIRKKTQLPGISGMAWPQTGHPSIKWCTLTFFKEIVSIEWWFTTQHPARENKTTTSQCCSGKPLGQTLRDLRKVPPNPCLDMANGYKWNDCWDDKLRCCWVVPFYNEHVLSHFPQTLLSQNVAPPSL